MINILYPDASSLAYLRVGECIIGPINSYVFGAPNLSYVPFNMQVGDDYIKTWPGLAKENNCSHSKWDGTLTVSPLLCGAQSRDVSTAGGFYQWNSGYTSVVVSTTEHGLPQVIEAPSAMLGSRGSDFATIEGFSSLPVFLAGIGFSLNGSDVHIFHLTAKSDFDGASSIKNVLSYEHAIYDLETLHRDVQGRYVLDGTRMQVSSSRYIDIDLLGFADTYSAGSYIESHLNLASVATSSYVSILWQDFSPTVLDAIEKAVLDSTRMSIDELSKDLDVKDFPDLVAEAVCSAKSTEVNLYAFIRDILHPAEMIPKLKNLRKLKTLSSNYLSVQYGWLPTIDDLKSLIEGLSHVAYMDSMNNQILTAGQRSYAFKGNASLTCTLRVKLAVEGENNPVQYVFQQLMNKAYLPSLNNIWDLVPYSFVIDWFIDIGSFLESVDTKIYYSTMDIAYCTTSVKKSIEYKFVPSASSPLDGTITQKEYNRRVSDKCPAPALSGPITTNGFNHYVEASALILQRTH